MSTAAYRGQRANLDLANDVGSLLVAAIARYPDSVHALINYFANGNRKSVTSNSPAEFVMLCGVIAAGACAAAQPEWREETFDLLCHYATSSYWRVRESVTTAYQQLLTADPQVTVSHLMGLAKGKNYLQQRAAVTVLSEPQFLYNSPLVDDALEIQRIVLEHLHAVPPGERKNEHFRVLRRALGYTLSVITAAAPEQGFALMRECAAWNDADITWILRENLKKKRLAGFGQTAVVSKLLPSS